MAYAKLNDVEYTRFQHDLLAIKGSGLQKNLLEMARKTDTFLQCMEPLLSGVKGDSIPLHENKLTQDEFKHLPIAVEKEL